MIFIRLNVKKYSAKVIIVQINIKGHLKQRLKTVLQRRAYRISKLRFVRKVIEISNVEDVFICIL